MRKILLLFIPFILLIACEDHGIVPLPPDTTTGFGGKITFIGEWPDSIKRTHLVVFKDPLESAEDFNILNLKFLSFEIPFGTGVYYYSSKDSSFIPATGTFEPGVYHYVAVVQQATEIISLNRKDWWVAGVYYNPGDTTKPGTLVIPENTFVRDIDIICDFDNPPPQPPGGN